MLKLSDTNNGTGLIEITIDGNTDSITLDQTTMAKTNRSFMFIFPNMGLVSLGFYSETSAIRTTATFKHGQSEEIITFDLMIKQP